MKLNTLTVENLSINIDNDNIINKVNFLVKTGDVLAILGPNGCGKSTLLKTIMNHYSTTIKNGEIVLNGKSINKLPTTDIAKQGIFYIGQNPTELDGIQFLTFLKSVLRENIPSESNLYSTYSKIQTELTKLDLSEDLLLREVNVGFSGGQKKKAEILQASLLKPKVLLLDEIDSGLDVDATKKIVSYLKSIRKDTITIFVSHNKEFIKSLNPNKVLIIKNHTVFKYGTNSLLKDIDKYGFNEWENTIPTFKTTTCIKVCKHKK